MTEREITPLQVRADHGCFGCGAANPQGLHLTFTVTDNGVISTFTPLDVHQGYEHVVHGGIISTLLDEVMAWAVAAAGIWAVTGEMQVRFRRPLQVRLHGPGDVVRARKAARLAVDFLIDAGSSFFVRGLLGCLASLRFHVDGVAQVRLRLRWRAGLSSLEVGLGKCTPSCSRSRSTKTGRTGIVQHSPKRGPW